MGLGARRVLAGVTLAALAVGGTYVRYELKGGVALVDPSNRIIRAEFDDSRGKRPLTRLPGGFYYGEPEGEGEVEVVCSDGTGFRIYVSSAMPVWQHIDRTGPCAYP